MIEFVKTPTPEPGIKELAGDIISNLRSGNRLVWLVSGGSNIPITVKVMEMVNDVLGSSPITNLLTVFLTDERYGEPGHKDSNWEQLIKAGLNIDNVDSIPVLSNPPLPLDQTVAR